MGPDEKPDVLGVLAMQYISLLITLAAALIGVFGRRHQTATSSILGSVSPVGWVSAAIAVMGFCFSAFLVHQQAMSAKRVRNTALDQADAAVTVLVNTLYFATYVACDESREKMPFRHRPTFPELVADDELKLLAKKSLTPKRQLRFLGVGIPSATDRRQIDTIIAARAEDSARQIDAMAPYYDVMDADFKVAIAALRNDRFFRYLQRLPEHIDQMLEREDSISAVEYIWRWRIAR